MTPIRTNMTIEGNEAILRIVGAGMGRVRDALQVMVPVEVTHENVTLKRISLFEAQKVVYSKMETVVCGVFRYFGKASGYILVSVPEKQLQRFLSHLDQCEDLDVDLDNPHLRSAVAELSNILGSSFLSVVADHAGVKIDQSVPEFHIDYAGSIISAIMSRQNKYSKWMYLIEGDFKFGGIDIALQFMNIPASQEASIFELAAAPVPGG